MKLLKKLLNSMALTANKIKFNLLDNLNIPYIVKISKANRLTLKINQKNELIILIPAQTKLSKVDDFIEEHLDWIKKNRTKKQISIRKFCDGENYLYLGKNYKIKIILSKYPTIVFNENNLFIYTKTNDYDTIKKIIDDWKIKAANLLFNEILYKVFHKMQNYIPKYPTLQIKNYKSRWGTCYFKRNQIILNLSLIHTNIECIEYVICHELAHFVYPNHSSEFHKFVNQFVDETSCAKQLKKFSAIYE